MCASSALARTGNGEALSFDDKLKYFIIEPNFISFLYTLVVTVMKTTGLRYLEEMPADQALNAAVVSHFLRADQQKTSVSRG